MCKFHPEYIASFKKRTINMAGKVIKSEFTDSIPCPVCGVPVKAGMKHPYNPKDPYIPKGKPTESTPDQRDSSGWTLEQYMNEGNINKLIDRIKNPWKYQKSKPADKPEEQTEFHNCTVLRMPKIDLNTQKEPFYPPPMRGVIVYSYDSTKNIGWVYKGAWESKVKRVSAKDNVFQEVPRWYKGE